ncbi:MAG: trypsin-like peptidase domain-containing protein [Candidatus Aureabacteria bacterium]|nr:trypsin-like peptidase domain-containing protein [Candidatus Auribacterota bacterium]
MKRYLMALAAMVLCACALIMLVAYYERDLVAPQSVYRAAARTPERSIDEIVEAVGPAVVAIDTRERRVIRRRAADPLLHYFFDDEDLFTETEGIGSGVIFDPRGYVLTVAHVVGQAEEIQVTLADGRQMEASLCAMDAHRDIAVLKLPATEMPVAPLGESAGLQVGQWVCAFGNPFGTASMSAQPSVSAGVISALKRNVRVEGGGTHSELIQTDAAINNGNNGGPLVDLGGRVIGLNTLILSSSGASTGVGFAMPIDTVREVLDELTETCRKAVPKKGAESQKWWRRIRRR